MVIPASPLPVKRRRGNPFWGQPIAPLPPHATAFELRAKQLGLTADMYTTSRELRRWCEENRDRHYIPEWLLKEWGITVNADSYNAA
jgi:hypothetical protein